MGWFPISKHPVMCQSLQTSSNENHDHQPHFAECNQASSLWQKARQISDSQRAGRVRQNGDILGHTWDHRLCSTGQVRKRTGSEGSKLFFFKKKRRGFSEAMRMSVKAWPPGQTTVVSADGFPCGRTSQQGWVITALNRPLTRIGLQDTGVCLEHDKESWWWEHTESMVYRGGNPHAMGGERFWLIGWFQGFIFFIVVRALHRSGILYLLLQSPFADFCFRGFLRCFFFGRGSREQMST